MSPPHFPRNAQFWWKNSAVKLNEVGFDQGGDRPVDHSAPSPFIAGGNAATLFVVARTRRSRRVGQLEILGLERGRSRMPTENSAKK